MIVVRSSVHEPIGGVAVGAPQPRVVDGPSAVAGGESDEGEQQDGDSGNGDAHAHDADLQEAERKRPGDI